MRTDAIKVTVYLSDGALRHGMPVYRSLLDWLFKNGVQGATATKGVAGFGRHHHLHCQHLLDLSDHLPIIVRFIETPETVEQLLPALQQETNGALIELTQCTILRGNQSA